MFFVKLRGRGFSVNPFTIWRSIHPSRPYCNTEDDYLKTSVNFITHPKEKSATQRPAFVTRYGPKGFVIRGSRVIGSLVIVPGLLLHWKIKNASEICIDSLELFSIIKPPIDIVVVGTGDKVVKLDEEIHREMRKRRIALEVQDTANACATYNFLLEEGRVIGAALIPPTLLPAR